MKKLYIIRKIVMAESVTEAHRLDKKTPILEIYLAEQQFSSIVDGKINPGQPIKGFEKKK